MAPQALIKLPVVMARTAHSRSKIYKLEKLGLFPKRITLGGGPNPRAVAWVDTEIDDYIKELIAQSRNTSGIKQQRHVGKQKPQMVSEV